MIRFDRRRLIKAGAIGALTFKLGGCDARMSPREARGAKLALETLNADEARTLDRLGDVLLPGASESGFTHFIDNQISRDPADSRSIIRYMDWPPPYAAFYQSGAAALESVSRERHSAPFPELTADDANALIGDLGAGNVKKWSGPPSALFYFVARSDAVDVVYGTMEGFEKLAVPYIPHIEPEAAW